MKIHIINKSKHPLPKHETKHAAAVDLMANIERQLTLQYLDRVIVPTGLYVALPAGYEAQIRSRSGLSIKHGVVVVNAPGTIDADYRGEIGVLLINLSKEPYSIHDGDRVAQMVIAKHEVAEWQEVEVFEGTDRQSGAFGSTGR